MPVDLNAILKAIEQIAALEQKVETAIASEKDLKRRARLLEACKKRDLETIREMLYEVE